MWKREGAEEDRGRDLGATKQVENQKAKAAKGNGEPGSRTLRLSHCLDVSRCRFPVAITISGLSSSSLLRNAREARREKERRGKADFTTQSRSLKLARLFELLAALPNHCTT